MSVLSDRERTRCGASQDSARQSRSAATARCTVVRSPLYPGHSIRGDRIRRRVAQIAVRGDLGRCEVMPSKRPKI